MRKLFLKECFTQILEVLWYFVGAKHLVLLLNCVCIPVSVQPTEFGWLKQICFLKLPVDAQAEKSSGTLIPVRLKQCGALVVSVDLFFVLVCCFSAVTWLEQLLRCTP